VMNNDAAVLIMTPVVVGLVRRVFPGRPQLVLPFAFAVFLAAGVAPLLVSNPMNLVMATRMGVSYTSYALHLGPLWLVGGLLTFVILRVFFRRELRAAGEGRAGVLPPPLERAPRRLVGLIAVSLFAYPLVSALGGPVWLVAAGVAAVALVLARGTRVVPLVREAVAWEVLAFMAASFLIARGLAQVGLVDRLADVYGGAGPGTVGACSALGSALLNNHPMSHLNMLAIAGTPDAFAHTLAALVGGDLGPRLFPLGSLAGLLWLEALRRQGVELSIVRFVTVGAIATVPVLGVSLWLLASAF
jgi:arsenical pump membrane protein